MPETDAVLRANETFYAAFAAADIAAMDAVWASNGAVSVIHPGMLPLAGRDQVMHSWREILEPADTFDIVCLDPQVQLQGDHAIVLCQERIGGHVLAASNTYRRTADGWVLVMHQAGSVANVVAPARTSVVH